MMRIEFCYYFRLFHYYYYHERHDPDNMSKSEILPTPEVTDIYLEEISEFTPAYNTYRFPHTRDLRLP